MMDIMRQEMSDGQQNNSRHAIDGVTDAMSLRPESENLRNDSPSASYKDLRSQQDESVKTEPAEGRNDGTPIRAKKQISGAYAKAIRKRYHGMRWTDKIAGRTFGFSNPVEAMHYFLDESGNPHPCTYCGRLPESGKVWGLDRIDSSVGHIPGNLVPCCSSHPESQMLSCQASKSNFSLRAWIEMAMTRTYGKQVPSLQVDMRMVDIYLKARTLGIMSRRMQNGFY
jgi:hypothetical protein